MTTTDPEVSMPSALAILTASAESAARNRRAERLATTAELAVAAMVRGGLDLLEAHGELVTLPIGAYGAVSFGLMDATLSELERRISAGNGHHSVAVDAERRAPSVGNSSDSVA